MITPLTPYINVNSPLQASLVVFIIPEEAIGWMLKVYGEVSLWKGGVILDSSCRRCSQ